MSQPTRPTQSGNRTSVPAGDASSEPVSSERPAIDPAEMAAPVQPKASGRRRGAALAANNLKPDLHGSPASDRSPRKPPSSTKVASLPLAVIAGLSALAGPVGSTDPKSPPPTISAAAAAAPPTREPPLALADGKPVQWWFAYKFSAQSYPGNANDPNRDCPFGGHLRRDGANFSQRYAYATSTNPTLRDGTGLIGTGVGDPLGATFSRIYNGRYYFVVWNDQFYGDPARDSPNCDDQQCGSP